MLAFKKGNNNKNEKVKGFTIWEMLLVLVLSSIVITMAVKVLFNVQGYFSSNQKSRDSATEFLLLKDQMDQDMKSAVWLSGQENIFSITGNNKIAEYMINDRYIIRQSEALVDTFFVITRRKLFQTINDNTEFLEYVNLDIDQSGVIVPFLISMDYDSKSLLEIASRNEHKPE